MMTCNDQGTFLHRTFPAGQLRRIAFLPGGQFLLVIVILLLGLQASKCQAEASSLKVGFLFNGPVGDAGWINEQAQYNNRIARFLDPQSLPIKNITGVYEELHLQSALNVMQEVLPDLHHVVALLDESPTGQAIRKQLALEVPRELNGVKLTVRTVDTMAEYLREIDKINADPDVQAVYPVLLSVKDSGSTSAGFRKTLATFQQRCRKPGIPVNFAFAQLGLFGGASVDFEAMGKQAGVMGAQLLLNKNIHHMPFESAQKAVITFNT